MNSDDERIRDWWFHRDRQLDWKDRLAATDRELEILRLRYSNPSFPEGETREPGVGARAAARQELADEIVADHQKIIGELREIRSRLPRDIVDGWLSALLEIEPLQPEAERRVQALSEEIERFLNRTTDWEMGRGSLGSGMVVRDSLNLIRSSLVLLAVDMSDHKRQRR